MEIENPVILFDGDCNLCGGLVTFLLKTDRKKQFRFFPLQSQTGQIMLEQHNVPADIDSIVFFHKRRFYIYSDAIIEIAGLLSFPWRMAKFIRWIPLKFRNRIYCFVAEKRFKWFGRRSKCEFV
jgi:predicted DCC family thiol-disulfide oxidoreductase YuxK